jgi:hypothetical protein
MGILDMSLFSWLGKPARKRAPAGKSSKSAPPNSTQFAHSHSGPHSGSHSVSQHSLRKDLLKVVLRETLMRNGIPSSWIAADLLKSTNTKKESGVHVRLLIRHWDQRLLACGVAFEQHFYKRLIAMDPQAGNWLMGVSWQYAMDDLSACPPLPHPGAWTSTDPGPIADAHPPVAAAADGPQGDVIEGPVMIAQTQDEVRADLERLLALRDDDIRRNTSKTSFESTQPIQL